jgi:hypothetical protein
MPSIALFVLFTLVERTCLWVSRWAHQFALSWVYLHPRRIVPIASQMLEALLTDLQKALNITEDVSMVSWYPGFTLGESSPSV